MKPLWNKLVGILLGLLLAGGYWVEVHAPQEEFEAPGSEISQRADLGPGSDLSAKLIPENTQAPAQSGQLVVGETVDPEELNYPAGSMAAGIVTPATETASCFDGPVGSGAFVWPADNHALTGNDYGPGHFGIDIAAGEGSPVYAADAGVVIALGNDAAGYGNVIQIDHRNGYLTVYAHLSLIGVSMCQDVDAGQWIGEAGSTGNARGAHLHFEVAQDGVTINPWTVLP